MFCLQKVPSKFVEYLADRTSGPLSLIGPSGNVWYVDLLELNGHLYFRDGWPTFVKDHSIQCGDTLVFRYNGSSNFNVQIFDESSCEKDEAFYADCSQGASKCYENLEKKRERDMEASMLSLVAEKKMRVRWVPVGNGEKNFKTCTKEGQKSNKTANGRDNRTKDLATASDTTVVLAIPSLNGPDGRASQVKFHVKKISPKVMSSKVKKVSKKDQMTDFQKIPSISKFIQSRAANYFTSNLPYFVRVMCYSNISGNGTMKIPTYFSKDHLPKCRVKVTLMNLNGDCWMVNSIPAVRRQATLHSFCGGWPAFVRDNSIKIEDVCMFELVSNFEMRVRVLRPGLEGLECQIGNSSAVDGVGLGGRHLEAAENVAHRTGAHPLQELDQTYEPCTPQYKMDKIKTDAMPYMQQEAASINTVDDFIAVHVPACASGSSIGTNCDSTADKHLVCYTGKTMSYQANENSLVDLQATHSMNMQPAVGEVSDALSFTSPFPSFMKVMMNSNVGGSFTLNVPSKFAAAHLPSYKAELVLRNLKGDSWNVVSAHYGNSTKFCGGWMSFARMNDVKVGDICVFELLDERLLQVRVFEGSHKRPDCVYDKAVVDDSTASIESTEYGLLPETFID
uniref:TF-B3 domain-containing protein n=1 Tax=Chenopodium quinoa TaxID=63459 RepID=A0A803MRH9_CHEQI